MYCNKSKSHQFQERFRRGMQTKLNLQDVHWADAWSNVRQHVQFCHCNTCWITMSVVKVPQVSWEITSNKMTSPPQWWWAWYCIILTTGFQAPPYLPPYSRTASYIQCLRSRSLCTFSKHFSSHVSPFTTRVWKSVDDLAKESPK